MTFRRARGDEFMQAALRVGDGVGEAGARRESPKVLGFSPVVVEL
jgi:hypothetical protein